MSEAAISRDARQLEMIEAMTECAFALAMAAGEIAKRAADDTDRFFTATDAFRHCAFAVRMGIRLAHGALAPARAGRAATEAPEQPERAELPERLETERERDRDYEPVSLPRFLKSLGLAAAKAEQRGDELPPHIRETTLPTLRTLLRQANAPPEGGAPAVAVLARPKPAPPGRARLLTSTVTPVVPPLRPTPPPRRTSG